MFFILKSMFFTSMGATVFQLSPDELKQIMKYEDELSKSLLAINHDGDVTSSYTCELNWREVVASVHPESPYLHIVRRDGSGYEPLQLTLHEYSTLTWFTAVLKSYQ
jgi:hypothetical protein